MSRLAAVLARALHQHVAVTSDPPHGWRCQHEALAPRPDHCVEDWADELVAAIPEPVREAIEAALDRCAFASGDGTLHCGYPKDAQCHRRPDPTTGARMGRHMFVPLVAP